LLTESVTAVTSIIITNRKTEKMRERVFFSLYEKLDMLI
jgi:hypothetical protein